MGRPLTPGIKRPPCPRGHEGVVRLDGVARTANGLYERTRFRCVPTDRGEKPHVFVEPMPARREHAGQHPACPHCERSFARAEGLVGGHRFAFVVREIATAGDLVWWRCAAGSDHAWQASVRDRTMRGAGCPFCAERRVARSGSLAVTHPDLAAQWHPTRNGAKTPGDVTYGSKFEAWWQCPTYEGHVWRARVSSRASMHSGCSLCAAMKRPGGVRRRDAESDAVA